MSFPKSEALEPVEHAIDHAHSEPMHAPTSTGLDSRKLVIWTFIASEVIFFMGLMSTYLVYRGKTPVEEGLHHLDLNVASANTFILLASSLTMVLSLQAIAEGRRRRMIILLILTALLGLTFLGGQVYEYSLLLFAEGLSFNTSQFTATFFTLTGFHGSHVFVGVLWIIALIIRAARGGITQDNHLAVELGGLYWHFVDLVWVVLFTIIYLI